MHNYAYKRLDATFFVHRIQPELSPLARYAAFTIGCLMFYLRYWCVTAAQFILSCSYFFRTLTYVFAVATWVYEYGALDWLRLSSLKEQAREVGEDHGAICWIVPVMCFSVLVGLGLDYDVFLISRVVEFRRQGLSNRAAIVMGVCKTGGIITAAGGIMAIAFAGLLFSQEPVLNELSFFLVFAVLVDTFVIRLLLVPALMVLLGDSNWWPGTVPNTPMDLDDF
eukprot:m.860006 g.860006  ORF g.860006 m.860006 type:complete len:224 (-) comp23527_c0_seq1:171-842(-)